MCGILGYVGSQRFSENTIDACLKIMEVRGQDARGVIDVVCKSNERVTLLHSRLSIIDLEAKSNQPFRSGPHLLIFNGALYNYIELRLELMADGYLFHTDSDTEVVLSALIKYGANAPEYFEGMWALGYYNLETSQLILSRDDFGEKPLFFYQTDDGFYFGSQPNFITCLSNKTFDLDYSRISRYLSHGFKSLYLDDNSFFKNLKMLEAGTTMIVSKGCEIRTIQNGDLTNVALYSDSFETYVEELRECLVEVVKNRLRADVPVAALLSGGVDSSAITAIANKELGQPIHCFSARVSGSLYDETESIDKTVRALKCEHEYIDPTNVGPVTIKDIEELVTAFSLPLINPNQIIYAKLCKAIQRKGYKVILTGTGGDELFGGYYLHHLFYLRSLNDESNRQSAVSNWQEHVKPLLRNKKLKDIAWTMDSTMEEMSTFEESEEIGRYFNHPLEWTYQPMSYHANSLTNRLDNDLRKETIPGQLATADPVSVYHSIENRAPLLSRKLYKLARSAPPDFLFNDGYGKYCLRYSVQDIVPEEVCWQRNKVGFNLEVTKLFNFQGNNMKKVIEPKSTELERIVNYPKVFSIMDGRNLTNAESKLLFSLMSVNTFVEKFGT